MSVIRLQENCVLKYSRFPFKLKLTTYKCNGLRVMLMLHLPSLTNSDEKSTEIKQENSKQKPNCVREKYVLLLFSLLIATQFDWLQN